MFVPCNSASKHNRRTLLAQTAQLLRNLLSIGQRYLESSVQWPQPSVHATNATSATNATNVHVRTRNEEQHVQIHCKDIAKLWWICSIKQEPGWKQSTLTKIWLQSIAHLWSTLLGATVLVAKVWKGQALAYIEKVKQKTSETKGSSQGDCFVSKNPAEAPSNARACLIVNGWDQIHHGIDACDSVAGIQCMTKTCMYQVQ